MSRSGPVRLFGCLHCRPFAPTLRGLSCRPCLWTPIPVSWVLALLVFRLTVRRVYLLGAYQRFSHPTGLIAGVPPMLAVSVKGRFDRGCLLVQSFFAVPGQTAAFRLASRFAMAIHRLPTVSEFPCN